MNSRSEVGSTMLARALLCLWSLFCVFSPADLGDFFFADKLATALGTEPVYVNMYRYRLQNKPFNRL